MNRLDRVSDLLKRQRVKNWHLLLLAVGLLGLHAWGYPGPYFGYDELAYVRLAYELLTGSFEHGMNLYAYRYAVTLPLTGLYYLFGFNDLTNTLLTVGTLTICVGIVLYLLRDYDWQWRALAGLFICTTPIHTMYLGKPMPDVVTELGMLMCLFAYYIHRFGARSWGRLATFGLFLPGFVLMFLSKESFMLLYPYFGILWMVDWRRGDSSGFWWRALAAVGFFLVLYFAANELLLGSYRARIDAIFSNRYFSECSYELQHWSVVLKRIGYRLWQEMTRMGMLVPIGFLVLLHRRYRLKPSERWILWTWLGLLLMANFMTLSYSDYVPLCPDPRHFVFTIPLGGMALALGMLKLPVMTPGHVVVVLLALAVQLVISVLGNYENTWWLFLPMLLAVAIRKWTGALNLPFLAALVGLMAMYVQQARYHTIVNYPAQRELLLWTLDQPMKYKRVTTDGVNVAIGKMYAHYDTVYTQFVRFRDQPELPASLEDRPDYLIVNGYTMYMSYLGWEDLPLYAREAHETWIKVYENKAGVIYKRPHEALDTQQKPLD